MTLRTLITFAAVSLVAITLVGPVRAHARTQVTECADSTWPTLQPSHPAYSDAVALARVLANSGFVIECIAPSHMAGMFEGQTGAALLRTNRGSFEALFLPTGQNFDQLQVIERGENARYTFSFAGRPTPWPTNLIESTRPIFFIKHTNRLLMAFDAALAERLRTALAGR